MDYTQSKGNVVELQCMSKFIEMGYECSIPYGNGAKYDFIVDYQGELLKIQRKACHHPARNGERHGGYHVFLCFSDNKYSKNYKN